MKIKLLMGRRQERDEGVVFIAFVLMMVVLLIGVSAVYAFAFIDYRSSLWNEWLSQATYAAEAGLDQKLVQLMQLNLNNIIGTLNFDAGGARQGTYNVFFGIVIALPGTSATTTLGGVTYVLGPCLANGPCLVNPATLAQMSLPAGTAYATGDQVLIATGTLNTNGVQQTQKVLRATVQSFPLTAPPAAVAIAGVAQTTGNITVDGRDHNASGTLTGAPGIYGISTSSPSFVQSGSSDVGGNGIPPANPANPVTIQVNAPLLPTTPEGILGLSPGSLDQYKTTTPPSSSFSGVVYLTTSWVSANLDGSTGILIVHNSTGTTELKNVQGTFKGLIITDDMVHINANAMVIGAVYGLKSGGVTIGNGNADVLYSSSVLAGLPLVNYRISSWEDAQNG